MQPGRKLLNLGCGSRFDPNWVNMDLVSFDSNVIPANLLKGIPSKSETFDVVYSSHFLEHFSRNDATELLKESWRVLKINGVLRVVVPNLEFSARLYLECLRTVRDRNDRQARERYEWALLLLIDQMVREISGGEMAQFIAKSDLQEMQFVVANAGGSELVGLRNQMLGSLPQTEKLSGRPQYFSGLLRRLRSLVVRILFGARFQETYRVWAGGELHRWMYDQHSMQQLLSQIGFTCISLCEPHESQIPDWNSYGLDLDSDGSVYKPNSLFVEAIKH